MFIKTKKIIAISVLSLGLFSSHFSKATNRPMQNRSQRRSNVIESIKALSAEIQKTLCEIKEHGNKINEGLKTIQAKTTGIKNIVSESSFIEMLKKFSTDLQDPNFQQTLLFQGMRKYLNTSDLITIKKMSNNNINKKLISFIVELIFKWTDSSIKWLEVFANQQLSFSINNGSENKINLDFINNLFISKQSIKEKINNLKIEIAALKTKWRTMKPVIPKASRRTKLTTKDAEQFFSNIYIDKIEIAPMIEMLSNYLFSDITTLIPFWEKIKNNILIKQIESPMAKMAIELFTKHFTKKDIQILLDALVKKPGVKEENAPIGYKLLHGKDKSSGLGIIQHVKMNLIKFLRGHYSQFRNMFSKLLESY